MASSASATVLCKGNESPNCLAAKTWPNPSTFQMETSSTVVGVFEVTCKETKAELTTTAGTLLPAEIKTLTFAKCSPECSVKARNLPWVGSIGSPAMGNGTLTVKQREGADPSLTRTCAKVACTYSAEEMKANLFGGLVNSAHLYFESAPMKLEEAVGGVCAEEAFFAASFTILSAAPVFVV